MPGREGKSIDWARNGEANEEQILPCAMQKRSNDLAGFEKLGIND